MSWIGYKHSESMDRLVSLVGGIIWFVDLGFTRCSAARSSCAL